MSLPIVFRIEAQAEFDEAFDRYERQQVNLGVDFLVTVAEVLDRIQQMSESHPVVFEDVRRAVVKRFPYLILYRVEVAQIVVIAVFHSKRDPSIWQART